MSSTNYGYGTMADKHVILKLKGPAAKTELFHKLCYFLDPDWPWVRKGARYARICRTCKGILYERPRLNAEQLRRIAEFTGVGLKLKRFEASFNCRNPQSLAIEYDAEDGTVIGQRIVGASVSTTYTPPPPARIPFAERQASELALVDAFATEWGMGGA